MLYRTAAILPPRCLSWLAVTAVHAAGSVRSRVARTRKRPMSTRSSSTPAKVPSSSRCIATGRPRRRPLLQSGKNGFFDNDRFFRVIDGFMVQFGINGNPKIRRVARRQHQGRSGTQSNKRGMVTFATAGPNTRNTQVFINFNNNVGLDGQGFSPFGQVVSGMDVVDSLYNGYGEGAPRGAGPDQGRVQVQGNAYLDKDFPCSISSRRRSIEQLTANNEDSSWHKPEDTLDPRHHARPREDRACGPISRPIMSRASRSWRARASTTAWCSIASSMASWRRPAIRPAPAWAVRARS